MPSLTRSPGLATCRIPSALPLRNFDAKPRSVQDSILGQIKQHSRIMRTPLVLQQSKKDSETADMEEEEEVEVVVKDTKTGKTIDCYVDEEVVVDGQEYALVYPCDTPVGDASRADSIWRTLTFVVCSARVCGQGFRWRGVNSCQ